MIFVNVLQNYCYNGISTIPHVCYLFMPLNEKNYQFVVFFQQPYAGPAIKKPGITRFNYLKCSYYRPKPTTKKISISAHYQIITFAFPAASSGKTAHPV
jgi:hypothetical protein